MSSTLVIPPSLSPLFFSLVVGGHFRCRGPPVKPRGPPSAPEAAVIGRRSRLGRRAPLGGPGSPTKVLDAPSRLLRSTAKRRAVLCRPDVVPRSVTMNSHRSLLTPSRTTNANPSRPLQGQRVAPVTVAGR